MIESTAVAEGIEKDTTRNVIRLSRLTDPASVQVGDCLVGIFNEVTGEGSVIHMTPGNDPNNFLNDPLNVYHIQILLSERGIISYDEMITTISYVREIREEMFYPWNDEAFFYRAVKDADKKIVGIEVSAKNNFDFTMTWDPRVGWLVTPIASYVADVVIAPVSNFNPVMVGDYILSIINLDAEVFFHYSINSKAPLDETKIKLIVGTMLAGMYGTLDGHMFSYGHTEKVDESSPDEADLVSLLVSITNPDGQIDYTRIPFEYLQTQLH